MNKETINALFAILKDKPSSEVAQVLRNVLNFKKDYLDLDSNSLLFENSGNVHQDKQNPDEVSDLRIKTLSFQNFRSVPYSYTAEKPYGVNFCGKDGKPSSLFIVGRNGAGKTTLYSALERHYISHTSLSREKNLDETKILTYGFGMLDETKIRQPHIKVETVRDGISEEGLDRDLIFCSPAPFCSEYDLNQLGGQGENLYNYMLSQLGYDELNKLRDKLKEFENERQRMLDDSNSISIDKDKLQSKDLKEVFYEFVKHCISAKSFLDALKHPTLLERDREELSKNRPAKSFNKYWMALKKEISQAEKASPIENFEKKRKKPKVSPKEDDKLVKMYERLEGSLRDCANNPGIDNVVKLIGEYHEQINSLTKEENKRLISTEERQKLIKERDIFKMTVIAIDTQRSNIVTAFVKNYFSMLKKILSFFSLNDGELQQPQVGNNELKILVSATSVDGKSFYATPQEYYNSFRFKLYAVSFKIALAFLEMSMKKIRVPVVIDDVFNASDFENNLRLENFVESIYTAYEAMDFHEPLQLILLTHDEMVQTAFTKSAKGLYNEDEVSSNKRLPRPYISARLFSHKVSEQMNIELYGESLANKQEFYNLYFPIDERQ